MRHHQARRRLAQVLDHTLPPVEEALVRAHAASCRRCARVLAEHEDCERLLQRLPLAQLADAAGDPCEPRLRAMARWAPEPATSWAERLGATALGSAAAGALVAMVWIGAGWQPERTHPVAPFTVAALVPDVHLTPMGHIH